MAGTLAWERVGGQFFRNVDGPPMRWGVRIAHSNVRMGACGGILAVWDRDDIVKPQRPDAASKPLLQLFDCEGVLMGSIVLDFGAVLDVLVTVDETVVVVTAAGLVRHYTDFGRNFVQLRLPFDVASCFLTTSGYIAVSEAEKLELASVTISDSAEPRYHRVSLDTDDKIKNCTFLPEDSSIGRLNSVLVVSEEGTAYTLDMELSPLSRREVAQQVGFRHVVISPSGKLVLFSAGKDFKVLSADFHKIVFEGSVAHTRAVRWVGDEALAFISQDGEAEILGLHNTSVTTLTTFFEEDEVALVSEIDGLRILSQHNHTLYMPVFQPTIDTFKLGSVAPSAILYSCIDQMDSGSPRSDQTVKLLKPNQLVLAVDTCVQAALYEVEPKTQKRLLKAAAFGKSIADVYDSSHYIDALPTLRIGNALRSLAKHPLFITEPQLKALGASGILKRLEHRKLWAEAVSVAEIEKIPPEGVYIEWACDLILTNESMSDEELFAVLDAKMGKLGAFSHAKMALRAIEQGRQTLASTLLESEPVSSDRVRLLLEMGMTQMALEQAGWSGNPYLVDYVLLILTEQLSIPQLMRVIGTNKMAIDRQQILVQLRDNPEQHLHEFLYHMDLRSLSLQKEYDEIAVKVGDAATVAEVDQQIHALRALEKKFGTLTKKLLPDARASAEWADLLALQTQLETDYQTKFVGVSAAETISILLKLPQLAQAQKLRTKLGISERQFWWLRLRALVDRREFDQIWELGQSKKSPIGYQPFFDACYEAGNHDIAARFVELIAEASLEDKVKMLVRIKHLDAARNLATKYKDAQLIAMLNAL